MKKNSTDTANKWLKAIKDMAGRNADVVPSGWRTIAQISKDTNKSYSRVRECVSKLVELKKVKCQKFRVATERRSPYPTWHYYLTDKDL